MNRAIPGCFSQVRHEDYRFVFASKKRHISLFIFRPFIPLSFAGSKESGKENSLAGRMVCFALLRSEKGEGASGFLIRPFQGLFARKRSGPERLSPSGYFRRGRNMTLIASSPKPGIKPRQGLLAKGKSEFSL